VSFIGFVRLFFAHNVVQESNRLSLEESFKNRARGMEKYECAAPAGRSKIVQKLLVRFSAWRVIREARENLTRKVNFVGTEM
jgi:hypothetical protein